MTLLERSYKWAFRLQPALAVGLALGFDSFSVSFSILWSHSFVSRSSLGKVAIVALLHNLNRNLNRSPISEP